MFFLYFSHLFSQPFPSLDNIYLVSIQSGKIRGIAYVKFKDVPEKCSKWCDYGLNKSYDTGDVIKGSVYIRDTNIHYTYLTTYIISRLFTG